MLDHETDPEEDAREAPSSPARWQMTPDGLRFYPANEVVPIAVTDTPFVYAAKLVHPDTNERWLVLRYQDEDGRLIEQVLSRGMLHKGKELLRHLDTHGLSCSADPEAEGLLVHYLKHLDRHSRRLRAVTRTGWDADTGLFIFPTGEVFGDDTSEDRAGVKLANPRRGRAWSRGGSLEGWQQQLAALAIGNSRLALAVCTPFAATLLNFAEGSESGGVHFDGASSIGKSSLQRAAASVFGLGASGEGLVLPWAGTSKGMSAYAALFTDLPFVLDEIGQARPAEVARIVMNVSNGAGTVAALGSGGARELPWWRTLMISSGNHAVEDIIGQNSEFDIRDCLMFGGWNGQVITCGARLSVR